MIDLAKIIREAMGIVGDAPVGDPAAMRAYAAKYRQLGERVRGQRARVTAGHGQLQFEGPAADRFAVRVRASQATLDRHAQDLVDLAALLERAAAQLAADQHRHSVRLEQTKGGLLAQASGRLAPLARQQHGPFVRDKDEQMTRLSMTPSTARTAATTLNTAGTDVEQISTTIRLTPCIEMPPYVAAQFEAQSKRVASGLQAAAGELGDEAEYLKARALLFEKEGDGQLGRWLDWLVPGVLGAGMSRWVQNTFGGAARGGGGAVAPARPQIQGPRDVSNEAIAQAAERQKGTTGGQCLKWVNNTLNAQLGGTWPGFGLGPVSEYQAIWGRRAVEVPLAGVRRGDIIQWDAPSVHTAIVTGTEPAFTLSESNLENYAYGTPNGENGTVSNHRLLSDAIAKRTDYRIWRVGTVN